MIDKNVNRTDPWSRAKSLVFYGIVPFSVLLVLVAMYFSQIGWMQTIVAPKINREFGLLESLQHVLLIAIVILAAGIARHSADRIGRMVFTVIAFGATIQFFEEIDWGLHYYEALTGIPESERAEIRNIHNQSTSSGMEFASLLKPLLDFGALIFFFILPLAVNRINSARLRSFIPSSWSILLLLGIFLISRLAHFLDDSGYGMQGSLTKAIGEFRELGIYYLFTLYLVQYPFDANSVSDRPN